MVRMSKLSIKLLRDIKTARLQFGAVILIILLAITTFISLYESYLNLQTSYDTTFQKLQMADYWITVDWIDQRAIREIDDIEGVNAIGRIEGEVSVDLANDRGEKVEARIISLPPEKPPAINNLLIEQGAYFSTTSYREVLMEQSFAEYHKFKPGDTITLKRNDIKINFKIAGIVTSPEFIWVVKDAQDVLPSARTFGILFMPQPMVESLFDMPGLCNDIILSIAPGTNQAAALTQVKSILRKNQITRVISRDDTTDLSVRKSDILNETRSAYLTARKDQATVRLLKSDLDQFSSLAILFPMLFLFMASLTIYVLMNRMVESQRTQIGIMRAIGYSRLAVLRHYIEFGLFVGLTGSILGALAGHLISGIFSEFYVTQLNLPYTIITSHWLTLLVGVLAGTGIPLLAGIVSVWSTLGIRPAEAMRPPVPAAGNRVLLRIFEFLTRHLPYILILPFRNIVRNLRRSLFMSIGVASAVIIIVASLSFIDAMESLLFTQYQVVQKYDARIIFQGINTAATANRISQFNGIAQAEAVLEAPFRLKFGNKKIDTGIMGLEYHSSMLGLVTPEGRQIDVVEGGILIPSSFNNVLGAQVGDTLILEPLVGTVGETEMKLAGLVDLPIGGKGIIPLGAMQKIMRQPGGASSILVQFDRNPPAQLIRKLYNLPGVATMEQTQDTRDYIDASMGFFWVFIGIMFLMGGMLGAGIIFNGVTVNVLQRTREIAVMRAVGMYRKTIALIITLENLAICFLGILIGLPLGRYTAEGLMKSMSTSTEDLFSFSLIISDRTYWFAAIFAVVIILLSQLPAIRRVTNMDLTVATKENAE